jgi:serine/threonine-protein kinase HipA
MITTAFVKIWGELVGAVAWNSDTELASFEFDSKFIRSGWDLAPLKMPISGQNRIFTFPELRKKREPELDAFKGLPGLLSDSLPDKYGNQLINVWLAQNGRPQNSMNPVEMLCFMGTRGMGALEFEPTQLKENKRTYALEIQSLVEIAQKMLSKRERFVANIQNEEEHAVMDILKIGTSAGGARPKAVIAYNEKTGEVRSGQTKVPKGFEHWLIKLDGVSDVQVGQSVGYGRVEMAYYLMASACGIQMMPCKLIEENGRAHFMTKRFDREDGEIKHHIQSWCALKHFDFNNITGYSYEQLFQTMRELKLNYPEAEQMYRRMVFNVLARNCDDHTKNFSFRLRQNTHWELAPAYDICHAYRPGSEWVNQHALSVNGKRTGILKEDLLAVAKSMNIKKASLIIDEINATVSSWETFAEKAKVADKLRDAIAKTLININK